MFLLQGDMAILVDFPFSLVNILQNNSVSVKTVNETNERIWKRKCYIDFLGKQKYKTHY